MKGLVTAAFMLARPCALFPTAPTLRRHACAQPLVSQGGTCANAVGMAALTMPYMKRRGACGEHVVALWCVWGRRIVRKRRRHGSSGEAPHEAAGFMKTGRRGVVVRDAAMGHHSPSISLVSFHFKPRAHALMKRPGAREPREGRPENTHVRRLESRQTVQRVVLWPPLPRLPGDPPP